MKKFIIIGCLVVSLCAAKSNNPYLKKPATIFASSIRFNNYAMWFAQLFNFVSSEYDFNWHFPGTSLTLRYNLNGNTGLALTSTAVPEKYADLFFALDNQSTAIHAFTCGTINTKNIPVPQMCPQPAVDYHVAEPRNFKEKQQVKAISIDQLASFIQEHSVVFYTGAGISIASGIPSMAQLEEAVHIERINDTLNISKIIDNAAEIVSNFKQFCESAMYAQPSQAHKAITALANKKQCAIFTENVDILHQKTGIQPIMPTPQLSADAHHFKDIDAIICVGLSHDDRGLLGFYKACNPSGIIIAIDLKQPDYMGSEDWLLVGDLQCILPMLNERILC